MIKRGQVPIGYEKLASETGLTVQRVRTALKRLKSTGEITYESTSKGTLVTLVNYEEYQLQDETLTSESTSESTNNQQTTNKQLTNNQQHIKNDKKVKNDKNDKKNIYGEFKKCFFKRKKNLKNLITNMEKKKTKQAITKLDEYKEQTGKKYKSDYLAMKNWVFKSLVEVKETKVSPKANPKIHNFDERKHSNNDISDIMQALRKKQNGGKYE